MGILFAVLSRAGVPDPGARIWYVRCGFRCPPSILPSVILTSTLGVRVSREEEASSAEVTVETKGTAARKAATKARDTRIAATVRGSLTDTSSGCRSAAGGCDEPRLADDASAPDVMLGAPACPGLRSRTGDRLARARGACLVR